MAISTFRQLHELCRVQLLLNTKYGPRLLSHCTILSTNSSPLTLTLMYIHRSASDDIAREYWACVKIQSWFRGERVRAYLRHLSHSAAAIQKAYRGYLGRRKYRILLKVRTSCFIGRFRSYGSVRIVNVLKAVLKTACPLGPFGKLFSSFHDFVPIPMCRGHEATCTIHT